MAFCTKCGAQVPDGSAFCTSCITGEKVKDVVEEAYCATMLCLLGNEAMEKKTAVPFPEEYKIPYMKF